MQQQIIRYITQFFDYFVRKVPTIKVLALYSEINNYYASRHGFSRLIEELMVNHNTFPRI